MPDVPYGPQPPAALRHGVILLAAMLAGCAGWQQNQQQEMSGTPTLSAADSALANGTPQVAMAVTSTILAKHPDDVAALVRQGNALYELKQNSGAAASYEHVLRLRPDNPDALLGLARIRLGDNPPQAEALLRRLVAEEPRNALAQNDLGIALDMEGRHSEAQAAYRKALAQQPDLVAAQVNLGLSYALGGDGRQSLALLQPVGSAPQASPRVREDLAAALAMNGNTEQAQQLLAKDLSQSEVAEAMVGYAALRP